MVLRISSSKVRDLAPIRGMNLEELWTTDAPISDFSPIRGMPIRQAHLSFCPAKNVVEAVLTLANLESLTISANAPDLEKLRALPNLKEIAFRDHDGMQPAAEFWAAYDAQKKAGSK